MRGLTNEERDALTLIGHRFSDAVAEQLQARGLLMYLRFDGADRCYRTTAHGQHVLRLDALARAGVSA